MWAAVILGWVAVGVFVFAFYRALEVATTVSLVMAVAAIVVVVNLGYRMVRRRIRWGRWSLGEAPGEAPSFLTRFVRA